MTPHRPVKRPRLLEAQRRKYGSIPHSANCGATWPFSTPEATWAWEVQVLVQRLPLSEPFNLAFSFLFQGCELRNTPYSFTVRTRAVYSALAIKTTLTPHLRISPYKGSVATVQIQLPFHAIVRSWTLLPPFGRLISSCLYIYSHAIGHSHNSLLNTSYIAHLHINVYVTRYCTLTYKMCMLQMLHTCV